MILCLLTTACQQEMARQPSYRPLEKSGFFDDGRASRPLVEGTVPRGQPLAASAILGSRKRASDADAARAAPAAALVAALVGNPTVAAFAALPRYQSGVRLADYVDVCPIDIDEAALERGRDRFNIYCSVCHDALGTGNGKVVERGYLKPPNYHTDYSRGFARRGVAVPLPDAPLGYYFEVITRGFGAMPDYASQIAPEDRWKIIAHIRVLQRSQRVPLGRLPQSQQDAIRRELQSVEERP